MRSKEEIKADIRKYEDELSEWYKANEADKIESLREQYCGKYVVEYDHTRFKNPEIDSAVGGNPLAMTIYRVHDVVGQYNEFICESWRIDISEPGKVEFEYINMGRDRVFHVDRVLTKDEARELIMQAVSRTNMIAETF